MSMDKVLAEVQARPYSLKNVDLESLKSIWRGLCTTLNSALRNGKGLCISNFGTWSFHVDPIDLGTQKKVLKTPVFSLSERFARLYNIRAPKQPSGISGVVAVRDLNIMSIAAAAGQPRDLVSTALKDIFMYAGECALAGATIRLEFDGIGQWVCSGGSSKFLFAPQFAGTFESYSRPQTGHGVMPPTPSIFAKLRPRSSGGLPAALGSMQKPPTPMLRPMSQRQESRASSRGGPREQPASPARFNDTQMSQELDIQGATKEMKPAEAVMAQDDEAQVFVLRDPSLDVKQLEIIVRGRELVVRQRSTGFERTYPLHSRVDTEKISAKFKKGALEIRIPDKASSLRSFYATQIKEREEMNKLEHAADASLIEFNERKNQMALDLERQALIARRRARAEIEAFNRKQAKIQKKDLFKQPDSCGYLLYNRKEDGADAVRMDPADLRKVLDNQVLMKQESAAKEKQMEREAVQAEVDQLKRELEEDEKNAILEKKRRQRDRMQELTAQIETLGPRVPGAFSAICDFPRLDNDDLHTQEKRATMRKIQEEVVGMVHAKGQQQLENKRTLYKAELDELRDVQSALEAEEMEKTQMDFSRKMNNRETWRMQINHKRRAVNAEAVEPVYNTSLPIGEHETPLVRVINPVETA